MSHLLTQSKELFKNGYQLEIPQATPYFEGFTIDRQYVCVR
jgi:hypothetical protein